MSSELDGLVGLHDDSVGSGEDILSFDGGKVYRLYFVPLKITDLAAADKNPVVKQEVKKGRAILVKKGDKGWFGPEDKYVLFPSLVPCEGWWVEGSGNVVAPKESENSALREQAIAVLGEPQFRYGAVVLHMNTRLGSIEPIELQGKMPRFDSQIVKLRAYDGQIQRVKRASESLCLPMRDVTIETKKQGKSVRWETVTAAADALFMDDEWCDAETRQKIYVKATKKRKGLVAMLGKKLSEAEMLALIGAKSAAEAAAGTAPPEADDNLGDLLDD